VISDSGGLAAPEVKKPIKRKETEWKKERASTKRLCRSTTKKKNAELEKVGPSTRSRQSISSPSKVNTVTVSAQLQTSLPSIVSWFISKSICFLCLCVCALYVHCVCISLPKSESETETETETETEDDSNKKVSAQHNERGMGMGTEKQKRKETIRERGKGDGKEATNTVKNSQDNKVNIIYLIS